MLWQGELLLPALVNLPAKDRKAKARDHPQSHRTLPATHRCGMEVRSVSPGVWGLNSSFQKAAFQASAVSGLLLSFSLSLFECEVRGQYMLLIRGD